MRCDVTMLRGAVRGASRAAFFLLDPCWTFKTTRDAVKRQKTTGDVGKWREWTWDAALSRRRSRVRGSRFYSAAMLLPLGTYLCRLSLRLLHPLDTVSAFAFLCIQRYTDNAAHAMEPNIEQHPQSVRRNNFPGDRYLSGFCSSQRIFPPQIIQVLLSYHCALTSPISRERVEQNLQVRDNKADQGNRVRGHA